MAAGLDQIAGTAYPTPSYWIVLIDQCFCQARSGTRTEWSAVTDDAGASWTFNRTAMPLTVGGESHLVVAATGDVWARNGWVTRDGGLAWTRATAVVPRIDDVAVTGHDVLAVGEEDSVGPTLVLSAATGTALAAAASQPFPSAYFGGELVATGSGTIYIQAGPSREEVKATSDDGNSWRPVSDPCAPLQPGKGSAAGPIVAFTADRLSVTCVTQSRSPASRGDRYERTFSENGGRTWTKDAAPSPPVLAAQAVSSTVAWASEANDIVRTIDGGHSWHAVWSAAGSGDSAAGTLESLVALAPDRAFAAFEIDTGPGTYFVIRTTTNGGATWKAVSTFTLPPD